MTDWTDIAQAVAAVGGLLISLIGFGVVIYQIRQLDHAVRTDAQGTLYQQSSEIRTLLVDRAHLRPYFFDNRPIEPDHEHYAQVVTIAEMMLNYLEHLVIQKSALRESDWSAWSTFVKDVLAHSPVMQEVLRARRSWYAAELHALAGEAGA